MRKANIDVGAKVMEKNGIEFFIRGVGFIKSVEDLEKVVIRQEKGTPIQVRNVATVTLGPDFRRGALDKARRGSRRRRGADALRREPAARRRAREGENQAAGARAAAEDARRRARLEGPASSPFYDRTDIVKETIDTLKEALLEEALMASAVIIIFLLHLRSTISVIVTLPLSVALCFILMYVFGVDCEHHVARGPRHRHRRRGRHGNHHDGKHLPSRRD